MNSSLHSNADPRILHAQAIKSPHTTLSFLNRLITLYSKSPNPLTSSYTNRLFSLLPSPNIVSWTSLISAHTNSLTSLYHFISMLRHPILPNQRTLASLFKACTNLAALSFGFSLHSMSLKLCLSTQPFSGSALVNFYFKCGLAEDARKVFDEMPERDEVCYGALIVGLAQNCKGVDALAAFVEMKSCGVASTAYSVSGVLRAAADMAALEQCRVIHGHAVVSGLDRNVVVGNSLIDGYGKAGVVRDARIVFDELPGLNLIVWNTMMAVYAQQGDKNSVMELFKSMEGEGFVPDAYSLLAMLTAFSNAGSFLESEQWLRRMKADYGVEPGLEHYTCLVGAMGRAGRLEEAERIATTMPFEADAAVWRALLSSCAYHGDADRAILFAKRLLELDPHDDSAYSIAANVLSAKGRWDEVTEVRKLMKDKRVKKQGGKSWIEVKGKVHVFLSEDRMHERNQEIYSKLAELREEIEKLGYMPVLDEMLHEVGKNEKMEALWYHSEKLALAFGMISGAAPPGKALRIVKNLRICKDCHEAFKYFSIVVEREIIVRDVNRYHRFVNGKCNCGGVW
ncbi:putative pentatricopeptide repeat-containing protein At5g52630 [Mercurialis annua]|uniref:putative pentatricopeptide repeat-containing protein At5g52630 n=1 Tax=Mercurialis annua TaxID=3986 RepID=UPI002160212A|nr:putative pentatricopeptide repeat-containing protein At5g52630 [Mercurialis annua]